MKIKYIHFSDPEKEKIYDSEKALKRNPFISMTQEEFDKHELERMKHDHKRGYILRYEILKEER